MKLEREVIIDLLPAYFSGEASAATRALVEDYFRDNPEFEKSARGAAGSLDRLRVPVVKSDPEKEKLALERARMVIETRSSFLWMAAFFTAMLALFRVHDHKTIWILWTESPLVGMIFSAVAAYFWLLYFYMRGRKDPLPRRVKFLWSAIFYSLLPFFFTIKDHNVVWLFSEEPDVAYILGAVGFIQWALFFHDRWKSRRTASTLSS